MAKYIRTRSLRRKQVKLPGGKLVTHYERRKPGKTLCASCKKPLYGTARALPHVMKKLPKSAKRPSRPYGGYYCSPCSRLLIKQKARTIEAK